MATKYFMAGSGSNWSNDANWSTTASSGPNNTTHAVSGDDVILDAGSPACIVNSASVCKSITCTGYTNTLTFNASLESNFNITWGSGMTVAGTTGPLIVAENGSGTSWITNGIAMTCPVTMKSSVGIAPLSVTGTITAPSLTFDMSGGVDFIVSGGAASISNGLSMTGSGNTVTSQSGFAITMTGGTWSSSAGPRLACDLTFAGNVTVSGTSNFGLRTITKASGTITTAGSTLVLQASCTLDTAGMTWDTVTWTANGTLTLTSALNCSTFNQQNLLTTATSAINCVDFNLTGSATTLGSGAGIVASGTITMPNGTVQWAGAAGFTCATLTHTALTTNFTYTFQHGVTYTITNALNLGTVGHTLSVTSDDGTLRANITLSGVTQNVHDVAATRIDSSGGRPIGDYRGTLVDDINWSMPGLFSIGFAR